jgi:hypothetical protein
LNCGLRYFTDKLVDAEHVQDVLIDPARDNERPRIVEQLAEAEIVKMAGQAQP